VTPDIADAIGMAQPQGAIVAWVLPDAPAYKAGLAVGDIILGIDGHAPTDERAMLREISSTPVGNTLTLRVRRDGEERNLVLTTREWPRNQWDARDAPMTAQRPKVVIPPNLGLTLAEVATDQRTGLGLEEGLDGVLVTGVASDSDLARRGIVTGDVILRVQDKPVDTPEAVQAGIDAARAANRDYVLMLILPKVRDVPGPKWMALELGRSNG
jgi:serine protease Do